MTKVEIKIGRKIYWIDENDAILDNGAVYQLVTKSDFSGWTSYSPVVSKKLFRQLKTCGLVYTNDELKAEAFRHYKNNMCNYYKFDIDKFIKLGGYNIKEE